MCRNHILRDLQPYVCTYIDCEEGSQLYDCWKEWASHETWVHNRTWQCQEHPRLVCYSIQEFRAHWVQHRDSRPLPTDDELDESAIVPHSPSRLCPICRRSENSIDRLQRHIAAHLEKIALIVFPTSANTDERSQLGSIRSDKAVQVDDQDLITDRELDWKSDSDAPVDDSDTLSFPLTKEALRMLTTDEEKENQRDLIIQMFLSNLDEAEAPADDLAISNNRAISKRKASPIKKASSENTALSHSRKTFNDHWLPAVFAQSRPTTPFDSSGTESVILDI